MTLSWQTWLPAEALDAGRLEQLLGGIVADWAGKWVGRGEAKVAAIPGSPGRGADSNPWQVQEEGLAYCLTSETELTSLMLGAAGETSELTPRDREVVEQLALGCLSDLRGRLTRAFGLAPDVRWRPHDGDDPGFAGTRWFAIGFDRQPPVVLLAVEGGLVAALVKSRLALGARSAALRPIEAGLASQSVQLAALLGRCELSLADLSGLAEGDVLVLDRGLDQPLELTIDGTVKPSSCTVEQTNTGLALKILEPLT